MCNLESAKQRATKDLGGYSYCGHGPGAFEVNGVMHHVDNPKGGSWECTPFATAVGAMRITMKREKDWWRPRMYQIKVDGVEVGTIQRDRAEVGTIQRNRREKWFWYAKVGETMHNTVLRKENRYFPTAKDALDDFRAWRKAL